MDRGVPILVASLAFVAGAAWLLGEQLEDTIFIPLDHPAIRYSGQPMNDPIARLDKKLESGQVKLDFSPNGWGYLPSVLKQLGVNIDSQMLVFSRTSIQTERISPRTPRAIYFNDEVAVGYVQRGEVLELTALDPKQGVVMYSLDAVKTDQPRFSRRDDCLRCHQGPVTLAVPGLLVSSVQPRSDKREGHAGASMTDHRIPFDARWGGWYVTGTHGSQVHLGNNIALANPSQPGVRSLEGTQNVTSLAEMLDTSKYLAPTSDLVALMTLEHQVRMTNLMTRIGWDARVAAQEKKAAVPDWEIDELVKYMLFADEAPLREPVKGVSTFTKTFAERGPRDHQGRSLRDFDLKTRLFRYRLSYMIYSAAFDNMPVSVRDRIYRRLYDGLAEDDRVAILAILRDTKQNLPAYFLK